MYNLTMFTNLTIVPTLTMVFNIIPMSNYTMITNLAMFPDLCSRPNPLGGNSTLLLRPNPRPPLLLRVMLRYHIIQSPSNGLLVGFCARLTLV